METSTTFLGLMFVVAAVGTTWFTFARSGLTRSIAAAMMTTAIWGLFKAEASWIAEVAARDPALGRFTHAIGALPWGFFACLTWAVVVLVLAVMYFFGLDENLGEIAADDDDEVAA